MGGPRMRGGSLWIVSKIAGCDLRMTMKERSYVFWMFIMPLTFMFVFGMTSRDSRSSAVRARLTVEDRDSGFLSGKLVEALEDESLYIVDSLPEGDDAVRTLVIPGEFTRSVLDRERVGLVLSREEGTNMNAAEAASASIFKGLIRVVSGLIEIEGDELEHGAAGISIDGDSLSGSLWKLSGGRIGALETLQVRLDTIMARDPLVTVRSGNAGRAADIPRGFQGSVPGSLIMFVLMSMVFSGAGITAERVTGVLKRLGTTPAGRAEVVSGKLLGRVEIAMIQIVFLLAAGRLLFRISLGGSPIALFLLMLAFAFCTGSFSILFASLLKNPDQVTGFAVITTLVMSALGGCWWPLEVVSRPFQVLAFFFPTGWAISGIHKLISFGFGLTGVVPHIAALLAFGVVFLLIAAKRLKWSM